MGKYQQESDLWAAFIRRLYAKGSLSIHDAAEAFADEWHDQGEKRGHAEAMCEHHLQMGVGHFLGVTYSSQRDQILMPDPQTDEQRKAWEDWSSHGISDSDDEWNQHWNEIPWRFSPGFRRRYQLHKFDYDKGIRL